MQVTSSHPSLGPIDHVAYSILVSHLELNSLSYMPQVGLHSHHTELHSFKLTLKFQDSPVLDAKVDIACWVDHLSDSTQHMLYPVLKHNSPELFYITVPATESLVT